MNQVNEAKNVGDESADRKTEQGSDVCVQCEANARWNEAGGYRELAQECRDYCRRGHKEESRTNE